MLKVFKFMLSSVLIIDTEKNTMFAWNIHNFVIKSEEDYQNEKKQRITKATINKHRKDKGYVVSKPILSIYAPEELSEWCWKDIDKELVGDFDDYQHLAGFFKGLYEDTKSIRETTHFVNFGSDLIDAVIAIRQGKTEQEFDPYGRKFETELILFRHLSKGRRYNNDRQHYQRTI